jgi:hypothetical protein
MDYLFLPLIPANLWCVWRFHTNEHMDQVLGQKDPAVYEGLNFLKILIYINIYEINYSI